MRHLDLFSGIGGFALAARWMGWETVQFVEIDGFCQKVLNKNFPNVPIHGDIKTFDGSKYRGTIDILTGGFPCQPFSSAGERLGTEDYRHLWPENFRIARQIQPPIIVAENVHGLVDWSEGLVFESVQTDLENEGYEVQSFILPACAVNATHRRNRVWFIAYNESFAIKKSAVDKTPWSAQESRVFTRGLPCGIWTPARETNFAELAGDVYGLPFHLDRIKSLGNAIVPQVAFEIFKAIEGCFNPQQ
jgi:DNA-cytosine methyltransferase